MIRNVQYCIASSYLSDWSHRYMRGVPIRSVFIMFHFLFMLILDILSFDTVLVSFLRRSSVICLTYLSLSEFICLLIC